MTQPNVQVVPVNQTAPAPVKPVTPVKSTPKISPAKPTPSKPVAAKPVKPAVKAGPTIVTASGATYKNTHVEKVDPDGIVISYTPPQGGMAMTKVYFDVLSQDIRQKYGYNPDKAKAFSGQ